MPAVAFSRTVCPAFHSDTSIDSGTTKADGGFFQVVIEPSPSVRLGRRMAAETIPISTLLTARQVLDDRRFVRLWIGQFISIVGDFVAMFAIQAAVVFRMHGTAQDIAGVTLAFLLPLILIGPVAGVFVDRWNPRRTMILSDVVRGGLILLLAWSTKLGQIYGVCIALSCVSSFFLPAQSVTMPLIVRREGLVAASSLMQQSVQIARIISPALASGLVGYLGEAACYYLDALTFFFSAVMLATLTYQRPTAPASLRERVHRRPLLGDLGNGLGFIVRHPTFSFVMLSMTAGTFAIGCFAAVLSVYVRDVLGAGTSLYGGIGTVMAIGTIGGAAAVGNLTRGRGKGRAGSFLVSTGLLSVGVFVFTMAACANRAATLVCAAGIGASIALVTVASTTLLQGEAPPDLRGRVSS